ncbi:restriction endonuclease subunit S [Streptomyces sp. NPDC053726]|uniref:restriction endonuclease subunit S n=1 Tax=Streptomyces sp. NPDC053726 TaxID=3365713 RepID=UPI0037D72670
MLQRPRNPRSTPRTGERVTCHHRLSHLGEPDRNLTGAEQEPNKSAKLGAGRESWGRSLIEGSRPGAAVRRPCGERGPAPCVRRRSWRPGRRDERDLRDGGFGTPDQRPLPERGRAARGGAFEPDTDSRFVLAFLSLPEVQAWIKGRAEMTTVASIRTKAMQQLPVLLPPIEEQRRIADLLCALDSQIGAHHQVVAAAERAHGELATLLMGGALASDEQTPAPDAMAAEPREKGLRDRTTRGCLRSRHGVRRLHGPVPRGADSGLTPSGPETVRTHHPRLRTSKGPTASGGALRRIAR